MCSKSHDFRFWQYENVLQRVKHSLRTESEVQVDHLLQIDNFGKRSEKDTDKYILSKVHVVEMYF